MPARVIGPLILHVTITHNDRTMCLSYISEKNDHNPEE